MFLSLFDMFNIMQNKLCLSSFNLKDFVFVLLILCNRNPSRIQTLKSFLLQPRVLNISRNLTPFPSDRRLLLVTISVQLLLSLGKLGHTLNGQRSETNFVPKMRHLLACEVECHTNKVSESAISTEIEFETSGTFAPKGYTALVNFGESIRIFHVDAG